MDNIIDFNQRKKEIQTKNHVICNKSAISSKSDFDTSKYRCTTGYVTWTGFITPPGYWVWIDDNEGPDNDPHAPPPKHWRPDPPPMAA